MKETREHSSKVTGFGRFGSKAWLAPVLLGGSIAWFGVAQSAQSAPYPDDEALLNPPAEEWLNYGRDYAGTHFSPLEQINAGNVDQLGLAWSYDTQAYPGQLEGTPLMVDGTLYGTLTWSVVFALDARTGEEKWRWDPQIPQTQFVTDSRGVRHRRGPSLCCGPVNRGVAVYMDKVYVGTLDGRLVALDRHTGEPVWETHVTSPEDDYSITGAPRVVKGMVITGNSGAEYGGRGFVSAYSAETGELIWRFYTVPGDPSKGFENEAMERAADTWTGPWWKFGGGGTVWDGMAYDPELNLFYFGVGNGAPWPRDIRSPGGGDNLYLTSILAVRPETGEYVWHYQTTPGDDWDYAATQPLILADLTIEGRERQVIMQAPKNGFFYVIDRATGDFISAEPFADVNWATGIDPVTGRPIETEIARYGVDGAEISPGSDGAHNWHSTSYNPNTGLVYIPGQETSRWFSVDPNYVQQPGRLSLGMGARRPADGPSGRPNPPAPNAAPAAPRPPRIDPQVVGLGGTGGFLAAINPVTQEERWRIRFPQPGITGGTLTTESNLLFHGNGSGAFNAYHASTGEKLWEVMLAPGFANPITYVLDGRQYVTVLTGRGGSFPPGRVYTFVLNGDVAIPSMERQPVPPLPYVAPPPDGFMGGLAGAQLPEGAGRDFVVETCTRCHTPDRIIATRRTEADWHALVESKYSRGYLGTEITTQQRAAIVDYLTRTLGRG